MKAVAATMAAAVFVAGCATSSKDVATQYVSPIQFQNYDCAQLGAESQRLTMRVQQLGGRLDEAAQNDQAIAAAGMLLFWPALFALGGTKQQEAEYGRLKGEAEALQQAAVVRKCSGVLPTPAPALQPTAMQSPAAERRGFRPPACDWPGVTQGVGAC